MPDHFELHTNPFSTPSQEPCRLLIVEDNTTDYELMLRELHKADPRLEARRVISETGFLAELRAFTPHLVCTDFRLPGFTGLDIVRLAHEHAPLVPVIVVTGTLSEEDAADSIKAGASDYVVKERLFRLVPAISGALEKRWEKEALREAQLRLERSESRALALLNAISDGVVLLDRDGFVLETNQPYAEFLGRAPDRLLGKCIWGLLPADQTEVCHSLVAQCFAEGKPARREVRHGKVWLDLRVQPVYSPEGRAERVALFRRDITEHKRTLAELELLGMAIAQGDESYLITDPKGTILYVNPAFEKMTGYAASETVGRNPRILKSGKHGHDFYGAFWATIRSGKTWQGRFINRRKDGSLYPEDNLISPVLDAAGTVTHFVGVKRDATRQIEFEKQMVHQERMQALGKMVSGIAHDFNNIMVPILGLAEELLSSPDSIAQPECVRSCLNQIFDSARDARDIVRRLREFYRPGDEVEREPVDLADIVERAIELTRPAWQTQAQAQGRTVTVHNGVGRVPLVLGNAAQLREMFVNLLLNAVDAIAESGEILIRAESHGQQLRVTVRDTGCGMDPELATRCLEPFFSTKGERGSGLGLSMCYGILQQHGGDLRIDSAPGLGTTVAVALPIRQSVPPPPPAPAVKKPKGTGVDSLRILVVDDEPMSLKVMQKLIERLGHKVDTAASGKQALETLVKKPYHLLVTDRAMPGMSGDELAFRAKESHPGLPVIMLTGFGDLMNYANETPPGVDLVIGKPASLRDLNEAITRVTG